jgi:pyridinium-3,5-bisthiocarboxylic acid mononucleotide nickel chelatase
MILGALLDLGLPLDDLRSALGSLPIDLGGVSARRVLRAGVSATKFAVDDDHDDRHDDGHHHDQDHHHHHDHDHGHHQHDHVHGGVNQPHHHSLKEISDFVGRSALSPEGKGRARHLFERLAAAEAAIHDMPMETVHLHEVGAIDSIVDIVGAVHGFERLGASRILSSPLNVGGGTVKCAHGVFPVPAPATARLLQGVPIYSGDVQMELVTPTGALLVTEYAEAFGPLPAMTVDRIGYGAGHHDPTHHPNVLRLLVGEAESSGQVHTVVEMTCEIDDMNPQLFGPVMDQLLAAGALDVFFASVQMKKGRPGTLVTVLARPGDREKLAAILFSETTTIGVRFQEMKRECLDREFRTIETPLGAIRFKIASRGGRVLNASPEFDDCARIAAEKGLPIKEVQAVALREWLRTRD